MAAYDIFNQPPIFFPIGAIGIESIVEAIRHVQESVRNAPGSYKQHLDEIKEKYGEDSEEYEFTMDHLVNKLHVDRMAEETVMLLSPIGMYRIVEQAHLAYLSLLYKDKFDDLRHLHQIDSVYKYFKWACPGFKKGDVAEYVIADELRELNNCIKHGEVVNDKLSKWNHYWTKGQKIQSEQVRERVKEFAIKIPHYLDDLQQKLNEKYDWEARDRAIAKLTRKWWQRLIPRVFKRK